MNLATKMIFCFLLVVIVAAGGFAFIIWKVDGVENVVGITNTVNLPHLLETNELSNNANKEIASIRGYVITKNPQFLTDYKNLSDKNTKLGKELIESSKTEEGKRLGAEVQSLNNKYSEIAEKKVAPLIQSGEDDKALQVMINELTPTAKALNEKLVEYENLRNKQITDSLNQSVTDAHNAKTVAVIITLLAIVIGIIIGFLSARSIARPVNELVKAARKVAEGDLTEKVEVNRQDEIGQLAEAFNTMVLHLKSLIKQVHVNAEQVAASSEELTANSEQSAQASNQIATSITDVANAANKQMEATNEASAVVQQM